MPLLARYAEMWETQKELSPKREDSKSPPTNNKLIEMPKSDDS